MSSILHLSPSHASRPRKTIERLLDECGVRINGSNPWDIRVFDQDFYARVLREGFWASASPTWNAGGTSRTWRNWSTVC